MNYISKLLNKNDIAPVTIIKKSGKVIFSGPHNGCAVPSCLETYLGMDKNWFCNAHETMDLHIDKLFIEMNKSHKDASFIYGNYSRLVCDLNAKPDFAISETSSEYNHIKIKQNQASKCCSKQRTRRIEEIYWPYHNAKSRLIEEKRSEHGGVMVLDIHSFTPTWAGEKREVEIGTLRCEKTPFSHVFEAFLKSQSKYIFVSGEPYRAANRESNAASLITQNNDLQYLGIEIRSDLISTDKGIKEISQLLKSAIEHTQSHKDIANITQKRSQLTSTEGKDQQIVESWVI